MPTYKITSAAQPTADVIHAARMIAMDARDSLIGNDSSEAEAADAALGEALRALDRARDLAAKLPTDDPVPVDAITTGVLRRLGLEFRPF